jgi:ATP adenylyltransferase
MDHIWSPWRYKYIASVDERPGCVFCIARDESRDGREARDRENLVLHRAQLNFIILNLFPYTGGHLMIVPYDHVGSLLSLSKAATAEMMELAKAAQKALEAEYRPDGFNIGMNLGRSAGAGVADHVHLHVVPRWTGDANYLSIIGETRVLPEDLSTTYDRLKSHFKTDPANTSEIC